MSIKIVLLTLKSNIPNCLKYVKLYCLDFIINLFITFTDYEI